MASDEMTSRESSLTEFTAETTTEEVTRCLVCPLETSQRKRAYLRKVIDEWQAIARTAAERLPSMPPHEWSRNNPALYKIVKEWPDRTISAAVAREATSKAVEAFASWDSNGRPGDRPIGEFGDDDYCRVHNQQITLTDHDGGGFGVKLNLIPYEPEWFGIGGGNYQTEILERVCDSDDNEIRHGSAEVYLHGPVEDGSATLHLTVVEEVEVYDPDGVERWLGVDLGERALYASAFVEETSDQIGGVEVESGREYRHHRNRLKEKRRKLSQAGDLRGVRGCRGEIERYTDHIVHVTSREIVDQAASRVPCGIRLERLTGYREDAEDPIHDWPYAAIQSAICYKATGAGIPVEFVDPAGTSARCNRCGQPGNRDGDSFSCGRCDYAVDADVNGAINIARGGFE